MVMYTLQAEFSPISVSSNTNRSRPCWMAIWIVWICCAITDSTSRSMRLNSSKHAQAPELASPLKNFPMAR